MSIACSCHPVLAFFCIVEVGRDVVEKEEVREMDYPVFPLLNCTDNHRRPEKYKDSIYKENGFCGEIDWSKEDKISDNDPMDDCSTSTKPDYD
jgi:hypothetical protein